MNRTGTWSIPVILWTVLAAAPLGAQQDEPAPDDADPAAGEMEEDSAARDDDERDEAPASPERFDPSEEISLDLPVSFPVDI